MVETLPSVFSPNTKTYSYSKIFSVNVDEWLSSVNMDTLGLDEDEELTRTPSRTSIITDSSGVSPFYDLIIIMAMVRLLILAFSVHIWHKGPFLSGPSC